MRWGLWGYTPTSGTSPTPLPSGISWKRRVAFPGRPWDGECGTPCGNLLLINATEPRTLCRLRNLKLQSGLHMGPEGLPGSAPPLPSPGHLQGHGKVQGEGAWLPPRGQAPALSADQGNKFKVLVSRALGPSSQHLPAPTHRSVSGAGDETLHWSLQRPRGHPGDWL